MNENLDDLRLKAEQLSLAKNKNWDELIAVFTKIIDQEQEPSAKVFAYINRAAAYNHRAAADNRKGDHTLAIADCDKALKLAPSDPLIKFIGLFYRGVACRDKGDYGQAIADFDEALRLKVPDTIKANVHHGRGVAYIDQENFLYAFKDFKKAGECQPVLKVEMSEIYVADQTADIYKDRAEEDGGRAFELYFKLSEAIIKIQNKQFYRPREAKEVAHYTSLHTLKTLATHEHFRLYNANYMNDPEEGRVFFEIMNRWTDIDIDIEGSFYRDNKLHPSPAYIGSFVKVDTKDPEQKDELFLWRTYGKHDGQEAAGACLIFKHEGTVFAEKCGAQIGAMQQLQSKLPLAEGDRQILEERQPRKPDLYKIVYSDEEINQEFSLSPVELLSLRGDSDKWNKQKLSEGLKKLAESLKQIKGHIEEEKDDNRKKELKKLACDLLDTIRFLFKARHYREEKEVRVVEVRYYAETKTAQEPDDIQVDTKQIPPRFYLEMHENFRFSEVILGPQARGETEWKRWLKEQDKTLSVKRSGIIYGKPYP